MSSRAQPALFVGHGNPMNAILTNVYADAWRDIGRRSVRPRAILAISAHWYVPETAVTAMTAPRTIHDFGGFPRALHEFDYPAPGDPELARRVRDVLAPEISVRLDESWGLDHGTWSVLAHLVPEADVPVVQLSIDERRPPSFHYELGKRLRILRDEGVLVLGSGNVVHNLEAFAWGRHDAEPLDWAERFDARVRRAFAAGDDDALVNYDEAGDDALLAVPTPEHYLPLLYVAGARDAGDRVSFPVRGLDGGSISMLAVDVRPL